MMPTVLNGVGAERRRAGAEDGGVGGQREGFSSRCTCGTDNALQFTSCCANING